MVPVSELTGEGLARDPSHSLSREYLTKGSGGLIAFKLKENLDISALLAKFKLVSRGNRYDPILSRYRDRQTN